MTDETTIRPAAMTSAVCTPSVTSCPEKPEVEIPAASGSRATANS